MRARSAAPVAALVITTLLVVAGCGGKAEERPPFGPSTQQESGSGSTDAGGTALPFTKNTTRVPGTDPVTSAALVARTIYPSVSPESRPGTVVLADGKDWRNALAAAALAGRPLRAPILLTNGAELPDVSAQALKALSPAGAQSAKDLDGIQVVRVGTTANSGLPRVRDATGANPAATAAAVDRVLAAATGQFSDTVVIGSSEQAAWAMPAAAYAAKAGAPLLWATRDALPRETRLEISRHTKPRILLVGSESVISPAVEQQLGKLGRVSRIAGADAISNAIALARSRAAWNVRDPGHGFVFANAQRPLDAAAAAPLSASGTYGPLLLLPAAGTLPVAVQDYLLDLQPGYDPDPVRGVYNHGWVIGGDDTVAPAVQARIDTLMEIQPVDQGSE